MYERLIVLTSDSKTYFFPTQTVLRPSIQKAHQDLGMDLASAGFEAKISKEVLQQGKYRIGIIFKNPSTNSAYFFDKPARYIVRFANGLSYEKK